MRLRALASTDSATRRGDARAGDGLRTRQKLQLLKALLELPEPILVPELHPHAPEGHALPEVEEAFGLAPGEGLRMAEDLADVGLLERSLLNRVNLCPRCGACQLNFRETCPSCSTLQVGIERLVHHFACAHVGPESEYARGVDLVCPKCERTLLQLGQDFDRPGETYVCRDHAHVFDQPRLEGQCYSCASLFQGHEARVHGVHRYRATPLAGRAVELRRLTGLDVSEMLHDAGLGVASRAFFLVELERELLRLAEQPGTFNLATLEFLHRGRPYPLFRRMPEESLQALSRTIVAALRSLDLVCRWDGERLALLLLGADGPKAARIRLRILERIEQLVLLADDKVPLEARWRSQTFAKAGVDRATAQRFLDGDRSQGKSKA